MKKKILISILIMSIMLSMLSVNSFTVSASNSNSEYAKIIEDYIGAYEMCLKQNQGKAPSDSEKIFTAFPNVNYEYIMAALIPPAMRSEYLTEKPMYFLKDIDGDNQSELFIGVESGYYNNQWLYGIFTYKNGELIDLFGNGIGYRDVVYLLNDNTFWNEGSGGWQSFYGASYILNGNKCNLIEELKTEENEVWYYNDSQISKDKANEILQNKRNNILYVDWKDLYDFEKEITVLLDGQKVEFDQPPVMINDRVMVPIRAIFEAMGYTVNWNGETQTAEAIKLNNNITVQINNNIIRYAVNEKSGIYECDVVPQIISGRTLVPVRAIAESAGCDVQWDGENTTVIITYYENSSNQLEERNAKALLLAGYDDDEDANKKQNHLDANRLSVDFVEEALNYLNITDVEKHYMEDNQKNMSALELVEILQNTFKNATDNDLSIIYYSGHTYTNHTTLFSGISFQNFYNLIKNNIKGTVLLMYDGCFAGELLNLSEYDDRIKIIAACDEDDYSSSYYLAEIDESSDDNRICSIFAYALYNGAINNMNYLDSNNDKTVAFDELYVYLLNSVYNICDRITTQEDKLNRLKDMLGLDSALRIAQIVQAYPNSDTTPLFTIK